GESKQRIGRSRTIGSSPLPFEMANWRTSGSMSTRKHWRGPPRWPRNPRPDPSKPIPYETIRNVYEYVEQRQRLLNRKQRAARVQASEVDRIQQGTAIFIWRSKAPPKSTHDLLLLTSQCSS